MLFLIVGCAEYKVDPVSGIQIDQKTPEKTVKTFFELQALGSFEAAHNLIEEDSTKYLSANDLKYYWGTANKTSVAKIFPARMKGNFAAVVYVRVNELKGVKVAMVGSELLEKRYGKWFVVRNTNKYSDKRLYEMIKLVISAQDYAMGDDLLEFNDKDKNSIKDQLYAFKSQYIEYEVQIKDRIENPEKYKETVGENTYGEDGKSVGKKVYEDNMD